jgi:hypothetical protein
MKISYLDEKNQFFNYNEIFFYLYKNWVLEDIRRNMNLRQYKIIKYKELELLAKIRLMISVIKQI